MLGGGGTGVIGVVLLDPAGQSACGEADTGGDGQERDRAASSEALDLLEDFLGVMVFKPGGGGISARAQLLQQVLSDSWFGLLSASEATEVIAEGAHGACGPVELISGLGLQHGAGLVTEALGLAHRVVLHLSCFFGGGVLDCLAGVFGVSGDVFGCSLGLFRLALPLLALT